MAGKIHRSRVAGGILILAVLLGLTGCGSKQAASRMSDAFYPISGSYVWLSGAQLLAVPYGNTVQLIDLHNQKTREVVLDFSSLAQGQPGNLRLYPFDFGIVAVSDDFDDAAERLYEGAVCLSQEGWTLTNTFIFDWEGQLIQECIRSYEVGTPTGSQYAFAGSGEQEKLLASLAIVPVWCSEEQLLINAGSMLFVYDLDERALEVLDDRRCIVPAWGQESVFWQIREQNCLLEQQTFYYTAAIDSANSADMRLYRVDEQGWQALFPEISCQSYAVDGDALVLWDMESQPEILWYGQVSAASLQSRELTDKVQAPLLVDGGKAFWSQETSAGRWEICCLELSTSQLVKQEIADEGLQEVSLWAARADEEKTLCYYETYCNGGERIGYYSYDFANQTRCTLTNGWRCADYLEDGYKVQWHDDTLSIRIEPLDSTS